MEGVVLQTLSTAFGFCCPRLSLTGLELTAGLPGRPVNPQGTPYLLFPSAGVTGMHQASWDKSMCLVLAPLRPPSPVAAEAGWSGGERGLTDLLRHWTFELSLAFFPHWFKQSKQATETIIPPHRSLRLRLHTWGSGHGQCERLQSCAFWIMVWRSRLILTWQRPRCLPFFHLSFWCVSGAA